MIVWSKDTGTKWLLVSFFTNDFYLRDAWDMVRSCQQFGPDYHVEQVEDRGWIGNVNHKPAFLLRMAEKFPDRHLLWLDADGRFRRRPWLLETGLNTPIAYRTMNKLPATGTLFLSIHSSRQALLEIWVKKVQSVIDVTGPLDQICLGEAVSQLRVSRVELPPEYCWIFDEGEGPPNPETPLPVIEHLQASRWTRSR